MSLPFHPQPKGKPRVLDKLDAKQELAAEERACRAAVRKRDQSRCRVPTCKAAAVHLHHLVYRSKGGRWVPSNIVSLCVTHHQFVHAGLLKPRGNADRKLTWEEVTR